jgi:hypothetical protein
MKKDGIPETTLPVDQTEETAAETVKEYLFKHTYIGALGVFYQGKSYPLTEDQRGKLKEDLE